MNNASPYTLKEWILEYKWPILLSLFFHFVAVFYSVGFFHFDEHFQILEFISLKLGQTTPDHLSWEFHERIRPWFQPGFSYLLVKFLGWIGIHDRFLWAMSFRFLSSLLGLVSVFLMAFIWCQKYCLKYFQDKKSEKSLIWLIAVLWYFPFFHARHSSDNWGASFFVLGMALLFFFLKEKKGEEARPYYLNVPTAFLVGLVFGFSFLARYQIGVAILFFYLWWLVIGKMEIKTGLIMTSVLFFILLMGLAIDSWGYGQLTFAPWNYLYADLILHVKENHLPTPWHTYFSEAIVKGGGPIGLLFVLAVISFWFLFPKDLITFTTLPFFIIHSLIGHKELRFIMPLIILAPFMSFRVYQTLKHKMPLIFLKFLFIINLLFLFISIFAPANVAPLMYQKVAELKIDRIWYKGESPYSMLGLPLNFYASSVTLENVDEAHYDLRNFWLITTKFQQLQEIDKWGCHLQYSIYPLSLIKKLPEKITKRSRVWALHYCSSFIRPTDI